MIAASALVLWIALAIVNGSPVGAAFPTQEECEKQRSALIQKMQQDGNDDGDAVSECVKVLVHRVTGDGA